MACNRTRHEGHLGTRAQPFLTLLAPRIIRYLSIYLHVHASVDSQMPNINLNLGKVMRSEHEICIVILMHRELCSTCHHVLERLLSQSDVLMSK